VTPQSHGISDLGQVAIVVSDVVAAKQFYHGTLGMPHLFDAGPNLCFLRAGSVRLMLTTPQGAGEVGKNSVLYFKLTGLETAYPELLQRGARAERPPQLTARLPDHELWIAFVRDPDGNLVGLMEEKPLSTL
jgi:predicted enzyme related to lactoylglutathione lyase